MICEETADGRVIDILENRVMIDVNDIHILFRPKNLPAHLAAEPAPRVSFFPPFIRSGRVFFRAWVMGMCARLRDTTSATMNGLLHASGFHAIWLESRALGYSAPATRRAILSFNPGIFDDNFYKGRDVFLELLHKGV